MRNPNFQDPSFATAEKTYTIAIKEVKSHIEPSKDIGNYTTSMNPASLPPVFAVLGLGEPCTSYK